MISQVEEQVGEGFGAFLEFIRVNRNQTSRSIGGLTVADTTDAAPDGGESPQIGKTPVEDSNLVGIGSDEDKSQTSRSIGGLTVADTTDAAPDGGESAQIGKTPVEDSNLAGIGSDEDKAAREAAAKMEFHWNAAVGGKTGVQIWRVENKRTENDTPDFGINVWPKKQYGKFHRGDSYIVLLTREDPDGGDKLLYDIYFWIGSESSQDEYGVAAYKTVELDDLLGGDPLQHRETEGQESQQFLKCFPKGISYLDGGFASGFRKVAELDDDKAGCRLYRMSKKPSEQTTRSFQVPLNCSSLNDGDAFLLDAGEKIYTWFGSSVSAFEKNMSATMAHNIRQNRLTFGRCDFILDVDDDNEDFWELLGGKGKIQPHCEQDTEKVFLGSFLKKMYVVSDFSGTTNMKEVPLEKSSLVSDDVCIVDAGKDVYIWIGKGSTVAEKQQSMLMSNRYLKSLGRSNETRITRVMEGQEKRCHPFLKVF